MGAIARRITRVITAVVCVAVSVGVSVATLHVPTREGGGERFNPARYRSDVIVTMFQANWKSVARECGEVLGPEGVGYVQVSPPQESIQGAQWWTSYQPVSYKLDSKEGTEAEFKNMVRQCKAAGVGVIADTVINHTTGVDKTQGTGTAGSPYDNKGDFPEAGYTPSDFHAPCSIWTYRDAESVWNCQVSGLQDLDTSSPHVRDVLSDYFVKLLDYGVAGFRVDAVKHMPPEDVLAIKKLVAKKSGRSMNDIWWTQEVIGDNAEAAEI